MTALESFRALFQPSCRDFVPKLTTKERVVLATLLSHADGAGRCYPSLKTIATATSLGRSTVARTLLSLELDHKMVSRTQRPKPLPTLYRLQIVPERDHPRAGPSQSGTLIVPERDLDSPAAGPELLIELPKELLNTNKPNKQADVVTVFEHWAERTGRSSARLTDKRKTVIRSRPKRFTPEQLCKAIDGAAGDEFYMSKPEVADIVSLFRNDERVEGHMERATKPSRNGSSRDSDFHRKLEQELR
jgi:hypothetical protein